MQKATTITNHLLRLGLACPKCKISIKKVNNHLACISCLKTYPIKNGIPILLTNKNNWPQNLKRSIREYEALFSGNGWFNAADGSYDCLAAIARGNKTLNIACGEGWIEQRSPNTIGLDFSQNALLRAKKNGAKYAVLATAENLPFVDNSFDIVICAGSLEHFSNPLKALLEMKRVAPIQVLTVHRALPIPFARLIRKAIIKIKNIPEQPIEEPFTKREFDTLLKKASLKPIFSGVWTYPVLFSLLSKYIPKNLQIASSYFVMSIRK